MPLGTSGSSHAASTGAPGENTSAMTGTECSNQEAPRQQIRELFMLPVRQCRSMGELTVVTDVMYYSYFSF